MELLNLLVRITARDEASEAVDEVSGNLIGKLAKAAATAGKALAGAFAVKKVVDFGKAAFDAYSEFEQLAGGAEKIFDEIDQSKILDDANSAWKNLNMSANEYLASINQTGAMFAQTMGDEKGYETAKLGMQAISDYATGTGRDINELNAKFSAITRAAGSYQSIADQFAGILPATSKDFLEQAKAAGILTGNYKSLTDVPVAEYQEAVAKMLEKGVSDLGLANNTAHEALTTLSGSMLATKSAWQNLVTEFGKPDADIGARVSDMFTAVMGENGEGGLLRNVTNEVGTIASNMISAVGNGIEAGIGYIRDNGPKLATNALKSIGDAIGNAAKNLGSFTDGFNLVDAVFGEGGVTDTAGKIAEWVQGIGQTISDNWPYIQEQLGTLWGQLVETAQTYGPQIAEVAGRLISMAGNAIVTHGPELLAKAGQIIGNLLAHIGTFAAKMSKKGHELLMGLITGTSDEGKKLHEWFADFFPDGLLAGLGDFATFLLDAGKSLIQGLIDGISEVAPDVGAKLQEAFDAVLKFFEGVGEFIADPIGSIEKGLDNLGLSFGKTSDKIEGETDRAKGGIDKLNKTNIRNKNAKANVTGNAIDGKAKSSVNDTDKAIQNLKGKSVQVDVQQKGLTAGGVDAIRDAIAKLKDKNITLTTTQTTIKRTEVQHTERAWGGIRPHARGDIMVADNRGPGVPLDIVGEAGAEAIVPLTSRYGREFAEMMGKEAAKVMGGGPQVNIYMTYNAGDDAATLVRDIADGLALVL